MQQTQQLSLIDVALFHEMDDVVALPQLTSLHFGTHCLRVSRLSAHL